LICEISQFGQHFGFDGLVSIFTLDGQLNAGLSHFGAALDPFDHCFVIVSNFFFAFFDSCRLSSGFT
jgi:hypothetical protein